MNDERATGSGSLPEAAAPVRGATDEVIDPWARGGAMSTAWTTPAAAGSPAPPDEGNRSADGAATTSVGRRAVLAAAGVALVVSATVWWTVDVDSPAAFESPAVDTVVAGNGPEPARIHVSDTLVGPVSWVRVDGDAASLPARLTGRYAAELFGSDASGRRWRSVDGRTWTPTTAPLDHTVGGFDWSVVETPLGDAVSVRSIDSTVPAVIDIVDDPERVGFDIVVDVETNPPAGAPIELEGGVFLFAAVSARLPWSEIANSRIADAHRVTVATADGEVRSTAGVFHEMPVSRFDMQVDDLGRHLIVDAAGETVWSFDPTNAAPWSPTDIVAGSERATWSRWTGERFSVTPVPWRVDDRVEIAATPHGVVASSIGPEERTPSLWHSVDGLQWAPVQLPQASVPGLPLTVYQGDGEVIVTATTELGRTSWATLDGATWEPLVAARGVDRRIRTTFGWVAADPRSAPQIHVSPDGSTWDLVDLGDMLGMSGADWDVTITVGALGSDIVVLAEGPRGRTALIGSVGPSS